MGSQHDVRQHEPTGRPIPLRHAGQGANDVDDAILLVRSMARAIERRLRSERMPAPSRDESECPRHAAAQCLQEQIIHLARLATLGTLAGSIAHELRQPVTAMRLEAYAIQRWMQRAHGGAAEIGESVRRIQDQAERTEQMIRSLRAMMRREAPAEERFRLEDAVMALHPLVSSSILNEDLDLQFDLAADLPTVTGDPVQIQQVVLNLLINAIEAQGIAAAGKGIVRVRVWQPTPEAVAVAVTDNGKGIPPEHIETVFEPFFSTKESGMGIGLAICRSIIERHGGTMHAESGSQRTTISFLLPCNR